MTLDLNPSLAYKYTSKSQISRVLSEDWVERNMYCPRCGAGRLKHFENNRPVADFYCPTCGAEYELKSRRASFAARVNGGAYKTMIDRINSGTRPDFFLLCYNPQTWKVTNLVLIPKHFFVPEIIEKRRPLSRTARRAGWVGCNINLAAIPDQGRIEIVANGNIVARESVMQNVGASCGFEIQNMQKRRWLMEVLTCINQIDTEVFTLSDVYAFEGQLQRRHPRNHNVKAKIRQALQVLRDMDFLIFLRNGRYRKAARK